MTPEQPGRQLRYHSSAEAGRWLDGHSVFSTPGRVTRIMPDGELEASKRQPLPAMTDRDCLLLIFQAICGLAERLTGERMTIAIELERGGRFDLYGDGKITWSKVSEAAPASRS
jgi:hypothetical protein